MLICQRYLLSFWVLCTSLIISTWSFTGRTGFWRQRKSLQEEERRRVCIVGAGLSGLISAKEVAEYPDEFDVEVFEKNDEIGGQWLYTDKVGTDSHGLPVHSAVYKYLRTNIPRMLMMIPGYKVYNGDGGSVFTHEEFHGYLKNYTRTFHLRRFIKFNTLVTSVHPILNDAESDDTNVRWIVETIDFNSNEKSQTICDAVMICNGHYKVPKIPKIQGIETFPGTKLHSKDYRDPKDFIGKIVVILGAATSGIDIAIEVSKYAKKVYLSQRHAKIESPFPANLVQRSGVVEANKNIFTLGDGSVIDDADAIIYCTGYLIDFPFLKEDSGIVVQDNKVESLYRDMININYPTMAVIGLPTATNIFALDYSQVRYFIALLRGIASQPSKEAMRTENITASRKSYEKILSEDGKFRFDLDYYLSGTTFWKAYMHSDLLNFRESRFNIDENGNFEINFPSYESEDCIRHRPHGSK